MKDISGILRSSGAALEAQAFKTFGAAVNDQVGSLMGLPGYKGKSFLGTLKGALDPGHRNAGVWDVRNYAAQIASGAGGFDPKNKFLFRVTFHFDPDVAKQASGLTSDVANKLNRNMTFIMKNIDMPKYEFEYEEFNYYNFRTKMLKRVKHSPLSFKMYDDVGNTAVDFLKLYIELLSPVNRRTWDAGTLEGNGFAFSKDAGSRGLDSSHRALLGSAGQSKNIMRKMVVEQYYLDRTEAGMSGNARSAIKVNQFTFLNPRLDSFDIDDQDYENGSEPHLVNCTFDFDALFIDPGKPAESLEIPDANSGLEILGDRDSRKTSIEGLPSNPFLAIIANQGGRVIQNTVANALYKSGMGKIAGGALANGISTLASGLGTSAARTLANAGMGMLGGVNVPTPPKVVDTTVGGSVTGQSSSGGGGG